MLYELRSKNQAYEVAVLVHRVNGFRSFYEYFLNNFVDLYANVCEMYGYLMSATVRLSDDDRVFSMLLDEAEMFGEWIESMGDVRSRYLLAGGEPYTGGWSK